jgi:hypothetical protein
LFGGCQTGIHGDVPLPQVHVCWSWWRTPIVVGGGAVGTCGAVVVCVSTTVSTVVAILATITTIVVLVVLIPFVVASIAGSVVIGLARRACCWSRTLLEQQPDQRCLGGFPLVEDDPKP